MKRQGQLRRTTTMTASVPAKAKCRVCREPFVKRSMTHVACSTPCAQIVGQAKAAKERAAAERADKRETRAKLQALKTRQEWLKDAEQAVNRYVRLRDAGLGCVSCDIPATWGGQWHASHLRSVGAASAVRFNLWNIHKACSPCNAHKSGNLIEYLPRVTEKIGAEKVEWLMRQNQRAAYSIPYLKRLKAVFVKKAKRLERKLT